MICHEIIGDMQAVAVAFDPTVVVGVTAGRSRWLGCRLRRVAAAMPQANGHEAARHDLASILLEVAGSG